MESSAPRRRSRTSRLLCDVVLVFSFEAGTAGLVGTPQHGRRLKLHFLPPHCPNENRIERTWLDLHANVTRNHQQRTMGALLRWVHAYLGERFHVERRLMLAA